MARTIKDPTLSDKDKRALKKLPGTAKPGPGAGGDKIFYHTITPGVLHLGYRRRKENTEGAWLARVYEKLEPGATGSPYKKYVLGRADDYRDADGKKVLSFNQARKAAEQKLEALEHEKTEAAAPKPLTVREAMADYIAYLKTEKKTGNDAERRGNVHILPTLGDKAIASLDKITLVKWRDSMAAAPARLRPKKSGEANYKPAPATPAEKRARRATVNRTMTILKAALNRAYDHDLVPSNKAWATLKPFEGVESARAAFLTEEEAKRLINAADAVSGFRALASAALLTGCRYGELCRMRVGDFQYGQITIHESKSGKPRHVVLADDDVGFFIELTAGRPADQLMFLRAAEGLASRRSEDVPEEEKQAWGPSHQSRPMLAACKAAKINPPIGFHQLRHTYASLHIMNGTPLFDVATNLGHGNTIMVEKHYGHLTNDYLRKTISAGAPKFGITSPGVVVPFKQPGDSDKSRFGVSMADIVPLEADEMLAKKGPDMTGKKWRLGEEDQPLEPDYAAPDWWVWRTEASRLPAMLAKLEVLAAWIARQDDAPAPAGSTATDEEFDSYLASRPVMKPSEQHAVLDGDKRRKDGDATAWHALADCLRADAPTPYFLAIVADLLKANALHVRAASPASLTKERAQARYESYVQILQRVYGKPEDRCQEMAQCIIALEECRDDEGFAAAKQRKRNDLRRKDYKRIEQAAALKAIIQRAREAQTAE